MLKCMLLSVPVDFQIVRITFDLQGKSQKTETNGSNSLSPEYKQPKSFSWEKYLEETGTQAAPARAFKPVWFCLTHTHTDIQVHAASEYVC